ncbi:MAG TPA: hypothetical protein VFM32_00690, partial [Spongiibacteraceae bacterium]|nr:hypothetical protein [Spongiibacteraceae bacterium]
MRSKPNSASPNFRHHFIFAALLAASSFLASADSVDDAKDLLLASDHAGAYQKLQTPAAQGNAEAQ